MLVLITFPEQQVCTNVAFTIGKYEDPTDMSADMDVPPQHAY